MLTITLSPTLITSTSKCSVNSSLVASSFPSSYTSPPRSDLLVTASRQKYLPAVTVPANPAAPKYLPQVPKHPSISFPLLTLEISAPSVYNCRRRHLHHHHDHRQDHCSPSLIVPLPQCFDGPPSSHLLDPDVAHRSKVLFSATLAPLPTRGV